MKRVFSVLALSCFCLSPTIGAQVYKCAPPGERVIYSDRKCNPLESRAVVDLNDNLMDGTGSTRDADREAVRRARLHHRSRAPFVDDATGDWEVSEPDADEGAPKLKRWDGEGESFTIHPFLGPGFIIERR